MRVFCYRKNIAHIRNKKIESTCLKRKHLRSCQSRMPALEAEKRRRPLPVRLFTYSPTRSAAQAATLYAGIRSGSALMTVNVGRIRTV